MNLPGPRVPFIAWLIFALTIGATYAAEVHFHEGMGGAVVRARIRENDSLVELARTYDVGFNAIEAANPGIDPFIPTPGTQLLIPSSWILPDAPTDAAIVINLPEMRLYHFPFRSREQVDTFPIGIGDEGWDTPVGSYRIIERIENPAWHVPDSIRAQKPLLPKVVPPGPDNPLGSHALRLSIGTVLIHGTDRPFGIGRRVSHGCIHLYPEDIVQLYKEMWIGASVVIVRQPVKATEAGGRVLVEVHDDGKRNLLAAAQEVLKRKGLSTRVERSKLQRALVERTGVPTDVTAD